MPNHQIANIFDLAEMLCALPTVESIQRNVYKYTDCGAHIEIDDDGVKLTSIVEGSDAEVEADFLAFPFSEEAYREAEAYVEKEVERLWLEANGESEEN